MQPMSSLSKKGGASRMKKLFLVLLVSLFWVSVAFAGGTDKEATALVEKGVAFIKAEGKEKAFTEFTDNKGKFVDRDLYIFVVDFKGLTLAHGGNAKLVGKDMSGLKDADGEPFIQKMIELAKSKGNGWVDYKWTNPVTKKIEAKTTYVQKVDDYFLGCGIYK
jgi:cytochrome c